MIAIILLSVFAVANAGLIPQSHGEESSYGHGHHYPPATSYQHVKIENYHSVPIYIKKEHGHLLEHPVSKGHTSTSVQVHHGGSHGGHEYHDPGYAIVSGTHQEPYQHPEIDVHHQQLADHQIQHEQQQEDAGDFGHYAEGGADVAGHGLQHYATHQEVADYGPRQEGGYEQQQEHGGYEQQQEQGGYEQQQEHGGYEQHQEHAGDEQEQNDEHQLQYHH